MTTPRDPDEILAAWLDDGPTRLPDQTLRAIAVAIPLTAQRGRGLTVPWRSTTMSTTFKLALGAAAVIAVVLGGAYFLGPPGSDRSVGGQPTASASPTASPVPSPSIAPSPTATLPSTAGWLPYTSKQYGYEIAYPPTWQVDIVATRDWVLATDRLLFPGSGMNGSADHFIGDGTGGTTAVTGLAADVPAGMSEDEWLASYYADAAFCPTMPTFVPITVDGHPGRLDPCYDAQAIVFIGGRVYVFAIHAVDNQPLFRAFLSTVTFPASAPSGSPGASAGPSAGPS